MYKASQVPISKLALAGYKKQTHPEKKIYKLLLRTCLIYDFHISHLTRQAAGGPGEQFGFADRQPAPAPTV